MRVTLCFLGRQVSSHVTSIFSTLIIKLKMLSSNLPIIKQCFLSIGTIHIYNHPSAPRSFLVSKPSGGPETAVILVQILELPSPLCRFLRFCYHVALKQSRCLLVMMPKLRKQRQQHPRHRSQCIPHLRALRLPLLRHAVSVTVNSCTWTVVVTVGVFLHGVHGNEPTPVSKLVCSTARKSRLQKRSA